MPQPKIPYRITFVIIVFSLFLRCFSLMVGSSDAPVLFDLVFSCSTLKSHTQWLEMLAKKGPQAAVARSNKSLL